MEVDIYKDKSITNMMELYQREREYQKCCFGDYKDIDSLNLASFLIYIEMYLNKAKKAYSASWQGGELPDWFIDSKEKREGSAPVEAYAELIKVFALAGAAIETFATIDNKKWRDAHLT